MLFDLSKAVAYDESI